MSMKVYRNLAQCNFFETGAAQICADLLEIRIDKKNQMNMVLNQKYCQSCHLISRNGFKEME
jgi:hypothetical protein